MSELLSIKHLVVSFPGYGELVRDVSFTLHRQERLGILGRSGAGKSLTAWAVTSVLPGRPEVRGEIWYTDTTGDEIDLLRDRQARLRILGRAIGIIPQNPFTSLNPAIACGKQVSETLASVVGNAALRKQCVLDRFTEVSLEQPERIYHAFPHELSGGQLQRVVTAMATINNPQLIIADEPTTALDTITQEAVLSWLFAWATKHASAVMFISHDLALLNRFCDRICVMEEGQLISECSRGQLNDPAIQPFIDQRPERLALTKGTAKTDGAQPRLVVAGLSKTFQADSGVEVRAVHDVSFDLYAGECVGLVGGTGCGKSTIARILAGLLSADTGQIRLSGEALHNERTRIQRRSLQMVFQDPYSALYPHYTVGAFLREALLLHNMCKANAVVERVREVLETVGLPAGYADKYPDELSGGERQRVQIARAVSVEPQVLICDESVSGLDVAAQARILGLLRAICNHSDVALLFISHDLSVVRSIADRVMVMEAGQIVESGRIDEVLDHPGHPVTQRLISVIPALNH
ncbi:MAG: ABC transporter ATP-binding protein [Saprospiraceae bacterium]|nr:ABC transporter ATP-binding protein [Saprospiraceae bacterium]